MCELTDQYKLGGRVTCGHMTKLSAMSQADLVPVARRMADAGVNVTVLTATELYLMGRDTDHNVRLTAIHALGQLPPSSISSAALQGLASDPNEDVRRAVEDALARIARRTR